MSARPTPRLDASNTHVPARLAHGEVAALSWARSDDAVNEDAALACERDDALLLAVSDGVGGLPGGERASREAVEALAARFLAGDRIEDAIERANEAVRALRGPACTLVASTLKDGVLRTFVIGDSQALLIGGRGRVKALTLAQSVVGLGTEAGLIAPEDAAGHPQRNVVTNVMGEPSMRMDRTRWGRLAPRDTLLLASDGLFDALPHETIAEVGRRRPLDAMLEELAARARAAPGAPLDDLTILAFRPRPVEGDGASSAIDPQA